MGREGAQDTKHTVKSELHESSREQLKGRLQMETPGSLSEKLAWSDDPKGWREPAVQTLGREGRASAKALELQTLEAGDSQAGGASGGFHVPQEECKTFGRKARARPDQTGRFVYVDGDDSYFPAEETEDTER